MTRRWQPLALAVALSTTVGAAAAGAQTVFVRHGTPADTVEVFVNATKVADGSVDAIGEARIASDIQPVVKKTEIDANLFLDSCPKLHRFFIAELARQLPAPETDCRRRQIPGLYWVRQVNTLVVDVGESGPSVLLVVGKYTPPAPGTENLTRTWRPAPNGVFVSGGGLIGKFKDFSTIQCGDVAACEKHDGGFSYSVGAGYWITRYLGAEVSYIKPSNATATGAGEAYRFQSELDANLRTVSGLVGGQAGPVRLYGRLGAALHTATATTTQTADERTVTVDELPVTIPGGTQSFETKTEGWGWLYGGGFETWFNRFVGIYGDFSFAGVNGNPTNNNTFGTSLDDRLMLLEFGIRVHIGR